MIVLSRKAYKALLAMLDRPPRITPELQRLMKTKPPWDEDKGVATRKPSVHHQKVITSDDNSDRRIPMKYTTRDLNALLIESIHSGTIAERNSIARAGATMIAAKQLEINCAGADTQPVVLGERS